MLLWLIGLHVAAVLYLPVFKKENLVGAMVHGKRVFPDAQSRRCAASWMRFVVGVVLAGVSRGWWRKAEFQFGISRPLSYTIATLGTARRLSGGPKVLSPLFDARIERLPMVASAPLGFISRA